MSVGTAASPPFPPTSQPASRRRRRYFAILVRVAIAAALTLLSLSVSRPGEVLQVAARARLWPLLIAIGLVVIDRALMAHRWVLLVRAGSRDVRPPLATLIHVFLVSTFLGTFLPTGVGGEAIRAYGLMRAGVRTGWAAASVIMDRLLGVLSLAVIAGIGLLGAQQYGGGRSVRTPVMLAIALCVAVGGAVFSARIMALLGRVAERLPGEPIRKLATEILHATHVSSRQGGVVAVVLAESLAVQVLRVAQAYCLGVSLGITASIAIYFALVPLILMLMLVPISINGIGTSQAAFVWLFGFAGVSAADAFLLSVLFIGLGMVGNLPGGLLYAVSSPGGRTSGDHVPEGR